MTATLPPEERQRIEAQHVERTYLELDAALACSVLTLKPSQWITDCERAGHVVVADTSYCEECRRLRDDATPEELVPPRLSQDPESRNDLIRLMALHSIRIACTYETRPAASSRRVVFAKDRGAAIGAHTPEPVVLAVMVDAIGPAGLYACSFYGEAKLEGAFIGLAALFMSGHHAKFRHLLELLEAYVARERIRADFTVRNSVFDPGNESPPIVLVPVARPGNTVHVADFPEIAGPA